MMKRGGGGQTFSCCEQLGIVGAWNTPELEALGYGDVTPRVDAAWSTPRGGLRSQLKTYDATTCAERFGR